MSVSKVSSEFRVKAQTASDQRDPTIAGLNPTIAGLTNGNFVVTWGDLSGTLRMSGTAREAVFIDPGAPDIDRLRGGARSGARVFVLDRRQDGLRQIADTLTANRFENLAAIHIVSHGAPGELRLGDIALTHRDLAERADLLATIGAALADDGDVLLYGCDVASGAAGRQFVEEFAAYTGANVGRDVAHPTILGSRWSLPSTRSGGGDERARISRVG